MKNVTGAFPLRNSPEERTERNQETQKLDTEAPILRYGCRVCACVCTV